MLAAMRANMEEAQRLFAQGDEEKAEQLLVSGLAHDCGGESVRGGPADVALHDHVTKPTSVPEGSRITEGVFDGQHMIGADGKQYLVPQNYASKSKLVEGDIMKLSITPQGAFIYKQIGPIDRKRVVCRVEQDEQQFWHATDGVHSWRVLTASVSFFKGKPGDEAVILIPSTTPSKWAAVENVISR